MFARTPNAHRGEVARRKIRTARRLAIGVAALCASSILAPAHAAEKLGVPLCDRFLEQFDACIASKPSGSDNEVALSTMRDGVFDEWKEFLSKNPGKKQTLIDKCKKMFPYMTDYLKPFGCAFTQ